MQDLAKNFFGLKRPWIAGLLVVFVLLLNALAAAPALHEYFHHDAGQVRHECAVTLFAHGLVDSAVADVAAVVTPPVVTQLSTPVSSPAFSLIGTLPPGRAPPVSSSNS